jgi:8-oxo-dGTP pyrophosphatase MutT (NUDIX family)
MSSKKFFCINCSKTNHNVKDCDDPIYSYGIICVKLDDITISINMIENFLFNKIIDIEDFNYCNLQNLENFLKYKNKIQFLMVQRKHSFWYVDFIRGKYDENNLEEIKNMISLMSPMEVKSIFIKDFDDLWNDLWKKTSKCKSYQKEFEISKKKFELIKKYNLNTENIKLLYDTPEWGFPKGRRDKNEKNIECAVREFLEETNINQSKYSILNRLGSIEETIIEGIKNKIYKLIYYIGIINEDIKLEINDSNENNEIGDIKWLSFEEALNNIRPVYKEKREMIYKIYQLFINLIENINNQKIGKIDTSSI